MLTCYLIGIKAAASADIGVQVLESNSDGVTVKLDISDFQWDTIEYNGETFQTVKFPGCGYTTTEGLPFLPVDGILIGVPLNAEFQLHVDKSVDANYSLHSPHTIYPVPLQVIGSRKERTLQFYRDDEFYATNDFYPDAPVALGFTGFLRDTRVLQVKFYPVQYNPAKKTVRLYHQVIARVHFRYLQTAPMRNSQTPRPESPYYESVLQQSIANYSSAPRGLISTALTLESPHAAPALSNQTWHPSLFSADLPGYKVIINSDGMYCITYQQLHDEDVELEDIDPRTFKLFNKGRQIPIFVRGEEDSVFDEYDEIIFRGLRNSGALSHSEANRRSGSSYYDPFSDENVYWLYWNGAPGLRMVKRNADVVAENTLMQRKFRSLVHVEQDNTFARLAKASEIGGAQSVLIRGGVFQRVGGVYTLPPLPTDSWFWDVVSSPNIKQYRFTLPDVAETSLNATVRVMLRGRTLLDHHTRVWLNEAVMLEDAQWHAQSEHFIERTNISQDFLQNGENIIIVESPGDTKAKEADQVLFNWVEVEYWREFAAVEDYLEFSVPLSSFAAHPGEIQSFRVTLSNFSNPHVEIYGTDGSIYTDNSVQEDIQKPGTYQVRFIGSSEFGIRNPESGISNAEIQYIAITDDKFLAPLRIIRDEPSTLRSTANGADYIIITPKTFVPSILPLAEWRQNQGLRVVIATVEDIYDEFNFGIFNPYAIKNFLAYAYTGWQPPAPTYVVLAGDASFKYKTDINFVPTILVQTPEHGAAASDNQFVTVSGVDAIPDLLVSRLPARNLIELNTMVEKILAYERSPEIGPWRNRLLLLSGVGQGFTTQSENLIKENIPPAFAIDRIHGEEQSEYFGGAQDVIEALTEGAAIVNFLGHGGGSIWSDNRMLGLEDIPIIENGNRLPFITSMTCYTGYFDNPHSSSLAEEMMKSENGGAIGFFGSTGLGWVNGDYWMVREIFDALSERWNQLDSFGQSRTPPFSKVGVQIGQIITTGKIQFLTKYPGYVDLMEIFTLFGDGALSLNLPQNTISVETTPSIDQSGTLHVRGTVKGSAFNGTAQLIVSDSDFKEIARIPSSPILGIASRTGEFGYIDVRDNRFDADIVLPSDAKEGTGVVRAYVWNDITDGIGYATYTIGGPHITNVRTDPQFLHIGGTMHVFADIENPNAIESATCHYWSYKSSEWLSIEMQRVKAVGDNTFRTIEQVIEYTYYIEVVDVYGRKSETKRQTANIGNPDLAISSQDIKWNAGEPSMLSTTIKNNGQLEAQNVVVQFFDGPTEDGMQIGSDYVISTLKGSETTTVQIEWQPQNNKHTIFVVIDPVSDDEEYGQIREFNERNNIASADIFKDTFILTPERGSGGLITSIDSNFFFELPQGNIAANAVLKLDLSETIEIIEQPDLKYAPLPNSSDGAVYQLNLSAQSETPLRAKRSKLEVESLMTFQAQVMIAYDQTKRFDVSRLAIYQFNDEMQKWLYIGSEQVDDKITATISESGTYTLMENNDQTPPHIDITVEHQGFIEGSYVSETPVISARITDENGVDVRPNRVVVLKNGSPVDTAEYTYSLSPTQSNTVFLSYAPHLNPGTHQITIQAADANNLSAQESTSMKVDEELEIINVANYPNPFAPGPKERNKGTIFAYILTTQADAITLKIYTATGRLVRTFEDLDAFADYNEYHWDGFDEDGEELSNGVYFYKLIVELEEDKKIAKSTGKLAILR